MKRKVLLLLFTVFLAGSVQARADEFLLGFTGFDYEDPDQHPTDLDESQYLELGDGYRSVGFVTSFGPLLGGYVNTTKNEYTYYLFGLTVTSHSYDALNQILNVKFNEAPLPENGRDRYFEDGKPGCEPPCSPGTPAVYGVFPPNATAPSTFSDGTLALGGNVTQAALYYDYKNEHGGFFGYMTQDEGTKLIYIPQGQRTGWHLTGDTGRPNATIPDGYDTQVSGECRIPSQTPATHRTWGAIKSMYHR